MNRELVKALYRHYFNKTALRAYILRADQDLQRWYSMYYVKNNNVGPSNPPPIYSKEDITLLKKYL